MKIDWRELRTRAERLKWARLSRTNWDTAEAAAESLGLSPSTYRSYEREGPREPPLHVLQRIARRYKTSWVWLVSGEGDPDAMIFANEKMAQLAVMAASLKPEKQEDAIDAALSVIESYHRKAN